MSSSSSRDVAEANGCGSDCGCHGADCGHDSVAAVTCGAEEATGAVAIAANRDYAAGRRTRAVSAG